MEEKEKEAERRRRRREEGGGIVRIYVNLCFGLPVFHSRLLLGLLAIGWEMPASPKDLDRQKQLVLSCFTFRDHSHNKYAKYYNCRYCTHFRDSLQDSITRLTEHVSGLRVKDAQPCKGCTGPIPLSTRQELQGIVGAKQDKKKSQLVSSGVQLDSFQLVSSDVQESSAAVQERSPSSHASPFPDNAKANELLSKAFVAGAVPFRFVENKYFVQFCQVLNQHYSPPTRKALVKSIDVLHLWVQ